MTIAEDLIEILESAAERWGIQPEYHDIWGRCHKTSPGTNREILKTLGVDTTDAATVARDLAAEQAGDWTRLLPACTS